MQPLSGLWALAADTPRLGDVTGWASARLAEALAVQASAPEQPANWTDEAVADARGGRMPYPVVDGVAAIGVRGVLLKSFWAIGLDVATGYEQIAWQVELAAADPAVRGIALVLDSPGGTVDGLFALTPLLRAAAAVKPMGAVIEGAAASAGYAIAAACGVAVAHPVDSVVGSIGVRAMHVAQHRWASEQGFDVTEMAAGARKLDFTPWAALSDALKAEWAASLDEWRMVFIRDVVEGRPSLTEDGLRATEAAVYEGPRRLAEALAMGLVDGLSLDPFAAFVAAVNG